MYSEFVERTGVYVSIAEFDAIVEVYNNSDVDKDTFCKLWAKMNFARVKAEKEQKAKKEKQHKVWSDLHDVFIKYQNKLSNSRNWYQSYVSPIGAVLSSSDEKKVIAFCELFHECYDKNAGLGSMLAAFDVWLKSVKNAYFAA